MTEDRLQEIARELLESHSWRPRDVLRVLRRALWLAQLQRFNWQVTAATKAAGVYRTDVYRELNNLGIRRP